ncbi:MAG: DUF1501 domain-containing protein [Candidatus Hydrogenedentes bacterium]|nr:DUF1501 domain-containing protein [Candidatus Hydrogenedentota bacterium]
MNGLTRRHFLGTTMGVGAIAWAALNGVAQAATPANPLATRPSHFAGKAKRVIYLHMAGSPPPMDLFDYKPKLNEFNGKLCPDEMMEKERFAFIKGHPKILGSPHSFKQYGQSGTYLSNLLPHLSTMTDEMTFIRSMYTEQFNHAPAQLLLHTGSARLGRPSMGSWATYGLGVENQDLPGFVVMVSGDKTPDAGKSVWGSGFLPTIHQGVQCRSKGEPVLYVSDPKGMDRDLRRRSLDAINRINEAQYESMGDPETLTRISQYELAFRMQVSVPEVMDISKESPETLAWYGATPGESSFANNCLLARRLVEQNVRFVQLFDWGWDTHGTGPSDDIVTQLPKKCGLTDRPITALLRDLQQRGLLEETLVVWSGEFGRTAMNEERDGSKFLGRDHNPNAFTIWMAGGGVKRGFNYGATDDFGYRVAENPVHVHDLQASILHLLGMDHLHLTFPFQGRDFRLTDVHGNVVHDILA